MGAVLLQKNIIVSVVVCLCWFCSVGLGEDEVESWILIGEPSRKHPGIHCKKYVIFT